MRRHIRLTWAAVRKRGTRISPQATRRNYRLTWGSNIKLPDVGYIGTALTNVGRLKRRFVNFVLTSTLPVWLLDACQLLCWYACISWNDVMLVLSIWPIVCAINRRISYTGTVETQFRALIDYKLDISMLFLCRRQHNNYLSSDYEMKTSSNS